MGNSASEEYKKDGNGYTRFESLQFIAGFLKENI
jgi:hypothetical protein